MASAAPLDQHSEPRAQRETLLALTSQGGPAPDGSGSGQAPSPEPIAGILLGQSRLTCPNHRDGEVDGRFSKVRCCCQTG